MRERLLDEYAASTFNACPHRPLRCMAGPPIEIHVDPLAKPMACHTSLLATKGSRLPHPWWRHGHIGKSAIRRAH